jgi:acyl-CoA reductase-like NAD-dependent aldehyde dehydrogenase
MQLQSFSADYINTIDTLDLRDPANRQLVIGNMPVCSSEHLDIAVEQARRAQKIWVKQSIDHRIENIKSFIPLLEENLNHIVEVLKTEQGMLDSVVRREVQESVGQINHTLSIASDELASLHHVDESFKALVRKVPFGVVGAIVPWNAPVSLATAKVIPALLAGNAVIVKPSPRAPAGVTVFLGLLKDCLPPGTLSLLHGLDELGEAMIKHRDLRKISFTGSSAVGKRVASSAAAELKSVQLELGGNDAAIVLKDADIDTTASQIVDSAFRRSGQYCYATKRVYVHRSIKEQMIEALKRYADYLKLGAPSDTNSTIGPVIDEEAQQRLSALIDQTRASNAVIRPCGTILESADLTNGCYVQPTLVWNIEQSHPLVVEEQFGPVLPILGYDDPSELVEELNSQDYGLSGSVWGTNLEELSAVAHEIEAGRVFINAARAMGSFSGELPSGGHKHSGIGWEKSAFGLREYYQYQTINGPAC